MAEKFFIQEQTENMNILTSISEDGQLVSDANPMVLSPMTKEQAVAIVQELRKHASEGTKYRVKAAGQAIRDYQYYLLTEVLPNRETVAEEAFTTLLLGLKAGKVEKTEPEAETAAEVVEEQSQPTDEDIDAMIAARQAEAEAAA